ncbi:MAG: hypothetical protein CL843_00015 [Crocinitomicaceae bacterium]|nr:hypothetical protein [Crocinitomicaceae bacterium]
MSRQRTKRKTTVTLSKQGTSSYRSLNRKKLNLSGFKNLKGLSPNQKPACPIQWLRNEAVSRKGLKGFVFSSISSLAPFDSAQGIKDTTTTTVEEKKT